MITHVLVVLQLSDFHDLIPRLFLCGQGDSAHVLAKHCVQPYFSLVSYIWMTLHTVVVAKDNLALGAHPV